jgi:ABC-2 type transport system permease protein
MSNKKQKKADLVQLLLMIAIILSLVYISQFFFTRVDLTSEKRFTLSTATKKILKNLDDVVFIRVYLDGDLNIPFKKMQKNIKETLDEFRVYAKDNVQYEFVNPFKDVSDKERNQIIKDLYDKGLQPTNIHSKDKEGGVAEKIIFPGAVISYRGVDLPVNLLKNNPTQSADQNINNSIEALEYEFINTIHSITNKKTEKIAFLEGQGELNEYQVGDITRELANYFQVDRGRINGKPGILDPYKAIIIAKPTKRFSEKDKYVLDQYIMHGGKVLWFLNAVQVDLDSLAGGGTIGFSYNLNLDDMLFRYGVRINPDLIQDIQCGSLPVNVALNGNPPKFAQAPWLYFPLLTPAEGVPVTQNLNLVKSEFASSLDTIAARKDVKKTVLLRTSKFTKLVETPVMINLSEIRNEPDQKQFNKSNIPVAVMLEGTFDSDFKNRLVQDYFPDKKIDFIAKSEPNKMLVVADGNIIRNDIRVTPQGTMISPLGLDKYTGQTFGNKDFITNAVNYMTDDYGLIKLRGREFKLRLLNREKITSNRLEWQLINTLAPVLLVILFGLFVLYLRKRKYAH